LKLAGAAGVAGSLATGGEMPVRINPVGVGNRGTGLVKIMLAVPDVEPPAIRDINEEHLETSDNNKPKNTAHFLLSIFA
jgi:hypothetical protein